MGIGGEGWVCGEVRPKGYMCAVGVLVRGMDEWMSGIVRGEGVLARLRCRSQWEWRGGGIV